MLRKLGLILALLAGVATPAHAQFIKNCLAGGFCGPEPVLSLNLTNPTGVGTCPSPLSCSRTSNATMVNASGLLAMAPNNLFLNSGSPATQSITTLSGGNYVLSFYGTGSVTVSAGCSFTLNGTGVGNRVSQACTTTGTSVTLTLSGTITEPQFEWQIAASGSPTNYNATAGSAYYGPRYDYTYGSPLLLVEAYSATNLLLQWNALTTTWSATNLTLAQNASSPDGSTDAWTLTDNSTSGVHDDTQAITVSSGATVTIDGYFAQGTGRYACLQAANGANLFGVAIDTQAHTAANASAGTGTITSTGVSATAINGLYHYWATGSISGQTTYTVGFGTANASATSGCPSYSGSGSTIIAYGIGAKAQSLPDSPIPTTTAQVTRAADSASALLSAVGGYNPIAGALVVQVQTGPMELSGLGSNAYYANLSYDSNNLIGLGANFTPSRPSASLGGGGVYCINTALGSWSPPSSAKLGITWNGPFASTAFNGKATTSASNCTEPVAGHYPTTIQLGTSSGPVWIKNVQYWNRPISPSLLIQKTSANDNFFRAMENVG